MVTIGAAFGITANIAYATSTHVAGLFVGQILMSALWAAIGRPRRDGRAAALSLRRRTGVLGVHELDQAERRSALA